MLRPTFSTACRTIGSSGPRSAIRQIALPGPRSAPRPGRFPVRSRLARELVVPRERTQAPREGQSANRLFPCCLPPGSSSRARRGGKGSEQRKASTCTIPFRGPGGDLPGRRAGRGDRARNGARHRFARGAVEGVPEVDVNRMSTGWRPMATDRDSRAGQKRGPTAPLQTPARAPASVGDSARPPGTELPRSPVGAAARTIGAAVGTVEAAQRALRALKALKARRALSRSGGPAGSTGQGRSRRQGGSGPAQGPLRARVFRAPGGPLHRPRGHRLEQALNLAVRIHRAPLGSGCRQPLDA